ncbi:MAG TPA: inositol monophosphatase family protein [Actinocrinis sp.]|uniref:inositol monophosphatase family protein n=1 Tax=Actinocrinis sp. TaxID=1920516 RepID=UPI002DDD4A17|nr:inositol monophosphatase family protein [Actinocrinis sp.]HEV2345826.1 inositol monophosphatase family protein [Actinocrinis sp.]
MPLARSAETGLAPDAQDLSGHLGTARRAAHAAGDFLRTRTAQRADFRSKGVDGDLVSDLDLGAEQLIVERLRADFPDIPVLAEEGGFYGATGSRWSWMVDPLDGTNNLAIGLSAYVVGIALCRDWQPVVSVVHEPETRRTWSAMIGAGMQGPVVHSQHACRNRTVVAWTQGYGVLRTDPQASSVKILLEWKTHRVLPLWAPLLGWVMLARGDIDAFVGYRPEPVDLPGGLLLARESGVRVVAWDGTAYEASFDPGSVGGAADRSFIAARTDRLGGLVGLVEQAASMAPHLAELASDRATALLTR